MKLADGFQTLWTSRTSRCERVTLLLVLLVCATTVFSTAIVQTLVVALTVAVVACLFQRRPVALRRTPLDLPFAAFVAARTISIAFSQDRALSFAALYVEYFYYLVFFLVTQTLDRDDDAGYRTVVPTLMLAAIVAALVGVAKVALSISPVASSTTAGTYTLGTYLCALLPLVLIVRPPFRTAGTRGAWFLAAALICLAITLTLDRLHWAGMAFTLIVVGLFFQRRILLLSLIGGAIVALVSSPVWVRLETIAHLGQNMAGRDIIWRGALMLIDQHPIVGFGPRTFKEIFPLFNQLWIPGVSSWHNDYLQVYMESGLLGLIPLLWIIATVYYHGWRSLRSGTLLPEERNVLLALGLSMTVVFLIGGMLDTLVGITFRTILALYAVLVSRVGSQRKAVTTFDVAGKPHRGQSSLRDSSQITVP